MYYFRQSKCNFKIWLLFILSLFFIFILSACSIANKVEKSGVENYGNLMSNIVNEGLAAAENECVYGTLNNGLYKMKIDGTGIKKISDDLVSYINVLDGNIYFSNGYP